jgi:hypothetical protein
LRARKAAGIPFGVQSVGIGPAHGPAEAAYDRSSAPANHAPDTAGVSSVGPNAVRALVSKTTDLAAIEWPGSLAWNAAHSRKSVSHPVQQIRFCRSKDGTRLAYASCGTGPPLVWLGHWVRHLELDWQSTIWRPWLALLTRRFRVIRFDWRGCGLSDREGVQHSLKQHFEDLEAVADAADLKQFVLFGQAGGGSVCMNYTARHPEA